MLQKVSDMNNRNNVGNLGFIKGQTNILPSKLLSDVKRKLAMHGLTVHIENGISSSVVEHEEHEKSRSENDLDHKGPVFPGPTIRAHNKNRGTP